MRYLGREVRSMLPNLRVGPSKRGGFGLFTRHDMVGGTFLTEYVGEYISHEDTRKRRDARTINFLVIDGSVHDQFDIQWYCGGHKTCSLTNTASYDRHERNTTHVFLDLPDNHPYIQTYDLEQSTKSWGTSCVSK